MKLKFYILVLLGFFLIPPQNCTAQLRIDNEHLKPIVDYDAVYKKKYIGLGVMGLIKHPGLEMNYSFPHKYYVKEKRKKSEAERITKIRRWDIHARYYYHRNFQHNAILSGGRTWQRSLKKDRFFISQADAGIARTFYTNPTFEVVNGVVQRKYFDGDFYASFNYRFGFGQHLTIKNETYRFYSYFGLMNFAPYNNLYYSRIVVGFNVNKFLKK